MMTDLVNGTLVRHASLGVGRFERLLGAAGALPVDGPQQWMGRRASARSAR